MAAADVPRHDGRKRGGHETLSRNRLGSEMRASCGVRAVGGLLVASAVSLYFIPLPYLLFTGAPKPREVSTEDKEGIPS